MLFCALLTEESDAVIQSRGQLEVVVACSQCSWKFDNHCRKMGFRRVVPRMN